MAKKSKSKVEVKPVVKKTKNNNGNNNKKSGFATSYKTEDCEFVKSCKSNTLKDDDEKVLKKVKNFSLKGDKIVFKKVKIFYDFFFHYQNLFFTFLLIYILCSSKKLYKFVS